MFERFVVEIVNGYRLEFRNVSSGEPRYRAARFPDTLIHMLYRDVLWGVRIEGVYKTKQGAPCPR